MFRKMFKVAALATALLVAVIFIPTASSTANAATLSVSDYVIKKDAKLYTLSVKDYTELKAAGHIVLKGAVVTHIKSSTKKIYLLNDFTESKAAIAGGNMSEALDILENKGTPAQVSVGTIEFDKAGNPTYYPEGEGTEPPAHEDFAVIDIR